MRSLCPHEETLDLPVALFSWIQEMLGSNLGRDTGYSDWHFRGFPQALEANAETALRYGHHRIPSNPFQFIYHPTIRLQQESGLYGFRSEMLSPSRSQRKQAVLAIWLNEAVYRKSRTHNNRHFEREPWPALSGPFILPSCRRTRRHQWPSVANRGVTFQIWRVSCDSHSKRWSFFSSWKGSVCCEVGTELL
jgi:hypothetical protein